MIILINETQKDFKTEKISNHSIMFYSWNVTEKLHCKPIFFVKVFFNMWSTTIDKLKPIERCIKK